MDFILGFKTWAATVFLCISNASWTGDGHMLVLVRSFCTGTAMKGMLILTNHPLWDQHRLPMQWPEDGSETVLQIVSELKWCRLSFDKMTCRMDQHWLNMRAICYKSIEWKWMDSLQYMCVYAYWNKTMVKFVLACVHPLFFRPLLLLSSNKNCLKGV